LIEIARDEIHLWGATLDIAEEAERQLAENLSADERERAERFTDLRAKRQFVVGRGTLRELLSRYTGVEPELLRFAFEGAGKPVLAESRNVEFNLSHSGGIVVYAVTPARAVGVDVEHIREIPKAVQLAKRFFSESEHARVAGAASDAKDREFLSLWVTREARAKAVGTTVFRGLESRRDGPRIASDCTVRLVDWSTEYVAAVAAVGEDWRIVSRGPVTGR
jgi:4'-phosphopantetheinyl transferase